MVERWKKVFIIGGVVSLILIAIFVQMQRHDDVESPSLFIPSDVEEPSVEYIYVDIKGSVEQPGVYKLHKGSRLFQAIDLAGGFTLDAFSDALNLSIMLKDQDVVYVPNTTEEYTIVTTVDDSSQIGGVININQATQTDLETLPGIGPSTAQKIIDYRNEFGRFETIEDIMNVSGIGESTYNNIKDLITV